MASWSWYVGLAIVCIFLLGVLGVFLRFLYLRWKANQEPAQVVNFNHPYNAEGQEMQWQGQQGESKNDCHAKHE